MALTRPFAYNTGSPISGTLQVGDLAIGVPTSGFASSGVKWWDGPDESLGYVIASSDPAGSHMGADGQPAYIAFNRSSSLTDASFLQLVNSLDSQSFTSTPAAASYLNMNGQWTSYVSQGFLGVGYPIIKMNIEESNTTGIILYGVPQGYGPGYATDWQPLIEAENGGAEYWEYLTVSYQQFSTPQSDLVVVGTLQLDETQGDYTYGLSIIADALVGITSSPVLSNTYTTTSSTSTTAIVSSVTVNPGEVAVVASATEIVPGSSGGSRSSNISSISGGGLTWQIRAQYVDSESPQLQQAEIWWAHNTTGSAVTDNITLNYSETFDDESAIITTWSGCRSSNPWTSSGTYMTDSNTTLPNGNYQLPGDWFFLDEYAPAVINGAITFPNHYEGAGDPNPNHVGQTDGVTYNTQIYISAVNFDGTNLSSKLSQLISNTGTLTLIQGENDVTYSFTDKAFALEIGNPTNVFSDRLYGSAPTGSITVTSPASGDFNTTDPIKIQYMITSQLGESFVIGGEIEYIDSVSGVGGVTYNGDYFVNAGGHSIGDDYLFVSLGTTAGFVASYASAGLTADGTAYIFNVQWGPSSSVPSGKVRMSCNAYSGNIELSPIDLSYSYWKTSNPTNMDPANPSLAGTFYFPAIFTFYSPITEADGNYWC